MVMGVKRVMEMMVGVLWVVLRNLVEGLKLPQRGQIRLLSPTHLNLRCQQSNVHVPPRWLERGLQTLSYLSQDLVPDLPLPPVPRLPRRSSPLPCPFPPETLLLPGNESTAQVQIRV